MLSAPDCGRQPTQQMNKEWLGRKKETCRAKKTKVKELKFQDSPQALQILLPTSSRLHNGVVLVPQLAQLNAPTAFFMRDFPLTAPLTSGVLGGGGSTTGGRLSVLGPAAAEPEIELRALLKVGHPEQAEGPTVPSHLPSSGHVPARCGFVVEK